MKKIILNIITLAVLLSNISAFAEEEAVKVTFCNDTGMIFYLVDEKNMELREENVLLPRGDYGLIIPDIIRQKYESDDVSPRELIKRKFASEYLNSISASERPYVNEFHIDDNYVKAPQKEFSLLKQGDFCFALLALKKPDWSDDKQIYYKYLTFSSSVEKVLISPVDRRHLEDEEPYAVITQFSPNETIREFSRFREESDSQFLNEKNYCLNFKKYLEKLSSK